MDLVFKHLDAIPNTIQIPPPFKIRATCYTKFRYKSRKRRKKQSRSRYYSTKIRANCNSPSKMVARSFQKTRLQLRNFIFFSSFFSSLRIYIERGGRVQLSWNVANFRANRRVFRMCSDSEKQVNLGQSYNTKEPRKRTLDRFADWFTRQATLFFFFFSFFVETSRPREKGGIKNIPRFLSLSPVFRNEEL